MEDDYAELREMEKELECLEVNNHKLHKQNKRLRKGIKYTKQDIKDVKANTAELKKSFYKINFKSNFASKARSQKNILESDKAAHKKLMYRANRYGHRSIDVEKMMIFQ